MSEAETALYDTLTSGESSRAQDALLAMTPR
jgi:hypothetical protein